MQEDNDNELLLYHDPLPDSYILHCV